MQKMIIKTIKSQKPRALARRKNIASDRLANWKQLKTCFAALLKLMARFATSQLSLIWFIFVVLIVDLFFYSNIFINISTFP